MFYEKRRLLFQRKPLTSGSPLNSSYYIFPWDNHNISESKSSCILSHHRSCIIGANVNSGKGEWYLSIIVLIIIITEIILSILSKLLNIVLPYWTQYKSLGNRRALRTTLRIAVLDNVLSPSQTLLYGLFPETRKVETDFPHFTDFPLF